MLAAEALEGLHAVGAPPADHLWYAHFDWGMTGPRWRSLARAAAHELDLAAELLPC